MPNHDVMCHCRECYHDPDAISPEEAERNWGEMCESLAAAASVGAPPAPSYDDPDFWRKLAATAPINRGHDDY